MKNRGFTATQLRQCNVGFDTEDLKLAGYDTIDLRIAGFTPTEIREGIFVIHIDHISNDIIYF